MATTIFSRITHPAPVPLISWRVFAISIFGIAFYTFGKEIDAFLKGVLKPPANDGIGGHEELATLAEAGQNIGAELEEGRPAMKQ